MSETPKKPLIRKLTGGADTELAVKRLRREEHAIKPSFAREHPLGLTRSTGQARQVRAAGVKAKWLGVYKVQSAAYATGVPAFSQVSRWGSAHTTRPTLTTSFPAGVPTTYAGYLELCVALYKAGLKELAARVFMNTMRLQGKTYGYIFGTRDTTANSPDMNFESLLTTEPNCYWIDADGILWGWWMGAYTPMNDAYGKPWDAYGFKVKLFDFKTTVTPLLAYFRTNTVTFTFSQAVSSTVAHTMTTDPVSYPTLDKKMSFTWKFTITTDANGISGFSGVKATPIQTAPAPAAVDWSAGFTTIEGVKNGGSIDITIVMSAWPSTNGWIIYDLAAAQAQTTWSPPRGYMNIECGGIGEDFAGNRGTLATYRLSGIYGDRETTKVLMGYYIDQGLTNVIAAGLHTKWDYYTPSVVIDGTGTETVVSGGSSFYEYSDVLGGTGGAYLGSIQYTLVGQGAFGEVEAAADVNGSNKTLRRIPDPASTSGVQTFRFYADVQTSTTWYLYRSTYIDDTLVDRVRYGTSTYSGSTTGDGDGDGRYNVGPSSATGSDLHYTAVPAGSLVTPLVKYDRYRGPAPGYPTQNYNYYQTNYLVYDTGYFSTGVTFSVSHRVGVIYMPYSKDPVATFPYVYTVPNGTLWGYFGTLMTSVLGAASNASITTAISTCKSSVSAYTFTNPDAYDAPGQSFQTDANTFLNALAIDGALSVTDNKTAIQATVKAFLKAYLTVASNKSGLVTDLPYYFAPVLYVVV